MLYCDKSGCGGCYRLDRDLLALGLQVLQAHAKELGTMGNRLQWAGYISSTGVYGDWQGDWVDER